MLVLDGTETEEIIQITKQSWNPQGVNKNSEHRSEYFPV